MNSHNSRMSIFVHCCYNKICAYYITDVYAISKFCVFLSLHVVVRVQTWIPQLRETGRAVPVCVEAVEQSVHNPIHKSIQEPRHSNINGFLCCHYDVQTGGRAVTPDGRHGSNWRMISERRWASAAVSDFQEFPDAVPFVIDDTPSHNI